MLNDKDIEAIAKIVNTRADKTEKILLDELERTRSILDNQIETVQKNLNEETRAAIDDVNQGKNLSKTFHSVSELMEDLNA